MFFSKWCLYGDKWIWRSLLSKPVFGSINKTKGQDNSSRCPAERVESIENECHYLFLSDPKVMYLWTRLVVFWPSPSHLCFPVRFSTFCFVILLHCMHPLVYNIPRKRASFTMSLVCTKHTPALTLRVWPSGIYSSIAHHKRYRFVTIITGQ